MTRTLRHLDEWIALLEMAIIVVGLSAMVVSYTIVAVVRFGPFVGWPVLVAGVGCLVGGVIWFPRATPRWVELTLSLMVFGVAATLVGLATVERVQTAWAVDLCRGLFLWVAVAGASLATKATKHLNIDVLDKALKGKGRIRDVIGGTSFLIAAAFSAAMVWITGSYTLALWRACAEMVALRMPEWAHRVWGDQAILCFAPGAGIPKWIVVVVFPIGFSLISIRFVATAIQYFQGKAVRADEATEAVAQSRD